MTLWLIGFSHILIFFKYLQIYEHGEVISNPVTLTEPKLHPGQLQVICIMDEYEAMSQTKQLIKYHNGIMWFLLNLHIFNLPK